MRPAEVNPLVGDASKAPARLKWTPEVSFDRRIRLMVDADLERVSAEGPQSAASGTVP